MGELSWEVPNAVEQTKTHPIFRIPSRRTTSSSLMFSLIVHGIGALILSGIVVSQRQHVGSIFSAEVFETPPPKPPIVKRRMAPRPLTALRTPSVREIPSTTPNVAVTSLPTETFSLPTVSKEPLVKSFSPVTPFAVAPAPRIAEVPRPAIAPTNLPVTPLITRVEVKPFSPTAGLTTLLNTVGTEQRLLLDPLETFKAELRRRIQQTQHYPLSARIEGVEGHTHVEFVLRRDGTLESVEVVQSSGSSALDDAAVAAVKDAAPYPPLPENQRGERLLFRLDLIFRLATN